MSSTVSVGITSPGSTGTASHTVPSALLTSPVAPMLLLFSLTATVGAARAEEPTSADNNQSSLGRKPHQHSLAKREHQKVKALQCCEDGDQHTLSHLLRLASAASRPIGVAVGRCHPSQGLRCHQGLVRLSNRNRRVANHLSVRCLRHTAVECHVCPPSPTNTAKTTSSDG
jgi:hypothetical protein